MNTLAFTVCFAVWMMNGVLVTFLVDNGVFRWSKVADRLADRHPGPDGVDHAAAASGSLTDKWGGRPVFTALLADRGRPDVRSLSVCDRTARSSSRASGSAWPARRSPSASRSRRCGSRRHRQGTALGIFGAGNAGAAITTLRRPDAPQVASPAAATSLEGWRTLPKLYAAALVRRPPSASGCSRRTGSPRAARSKTLAQRLAPLKRVRVWRFGLYYFLVFGGFVALAQWLVPYYVNVYAMSLAMAGLLASVDQPALGARARPGRLALRQVRAPGWSCTGSSASASSAACS